jgi:DNA polymerase-3 subunit chi
MTEITFYTFADNPLDVARRVAAKAHGQGKQVMIYAPDAAVADAIDRLLWTTPALGFVRTAATAMRWRAKRRY